MRVDLSPELLSKLEEWRASYGTRDDVERQYDAFLLFGGMGPCLYVTRTGEFLVGADAVFDEPEVRVANEDEAIAALVIGSKFVPELLDLVAGRPSGAAACDLCLGTRWHPGKSISGTWPVMICTECRGRGWVLPQPEK